MARIFKARYRGTCADCAEPIGVGQPIKSAGRKRYAHATCTPDEGYRELPGSVRGMCEDAPCCGCCGTNIYGVYQGAY